MDDFAWMAAALALATIKTQGGSAVDGDVEVRGDVAMRDIIYAPQDVWRRNIDERLRDQQDAIMELRRSQNYQWIAIGLIALLYLFTVIVSSGLIVRQFDQFGLEIDRQFDRIELQLQRRIP